MQLPKGIQQTTRIIHRQIFRALFVWSGRSVTGYSKCQLPDEFSHAYLLFSTAGIIES